MKRTEEISKIENIRSEWDVIVVGGGATGLGVALESSVKGYKTLLLEQYDFAKSTSSKSTKLVHGGVRYLAQGYVDLVREACKERGLFLQNAPHLTQNVSFVIPLYSFFDIIMYTVGLKFYDLLAGKLSLGKSKYISKKETLKRLPTVKQAGLRGGILYHDGQFDDTRMAVNMAQTIVEHGGCVLNYAKVENLLHDEKGQVNGVIFSDEISGKTYNVHCKAVVNAAGVFADSINSMDQKKEVKTIAPSQGIHLVLDNKFSPTDNAIMIPKTDDGRVLFVIPWHNKLVVGTTDTPVKEENIEPRALEQEIEFVLSTASRYLVGKPTRKDVLCVFAGLRPLAANNKIDSTKTKEVSRSHKITVSNTRLFSIIGGKWTTYRKMGEDMVHTIEEKLKWEVLASKTQHLKIHGYSEKTDKNEALSIYGCDADAINAISRTEENAQGWLSETLRISKAQLLWAIRNEMIEKVEDFLARRTRALFLNVEESVLMAPEVARIMAQQMEKDERWVENELNEYRELVKNYTC